MSAEFSILTMEVLKKVKKYGCKVLYIKSHTYDFKNLYIEGDNGEVR